MAFLGVSPLVEGHQARQGWMEEQSGCVHHVHVPMSQKMLFPWPGSVAIAVLVMLGQPGLLGASEPSSCDVALLACTSVLVDLGVPRARG